MNAEAALRRAVTTDLTCAAEMWFKNRLTGKPYRWVTCGLSPGHDCPHAEIDREDGSRYAEWLDDSAPMYSGRPRDDWTVVFHHTVRSPWTEDELVELALAGGLYINS